MGPSVKAVDCPPEKPKDPIPGCFGIPELPLLAPTGTVSTINCAYSTQPASNIDLGTISGCVPDPTNLPAAAATTAPTTTQTSHAAGDSQAVVAALESAMVVPGLNPTKVSEIPAGATVVTETVSDKPLVVTYVPSKATVDVTSTTTDKDGHTGVTVIPKGGWIWALSGPPPSGGPPPLPGPPGGIAAPKDPSQPKDPENSENSTNPDDKKDDPDNEHSSKATSTPFSTVSPTQSPTMSSTPSSTVNSATSSTSSAASCDLADVDIAPDYPFMIDSNGEELPILKNFGLFSLFSGVTATPVAPTSSPLPSKTPEPLVVATPTTPPPSSSPSPSPSPSEAPKVLPATQSIKACKSDDDCGDHVCLAGKSTCEDLGAPEVKMKIKK
ncbi:MAG: hypothetical protein OHK93_001734 [Ramalina farinacea]|uniref:Uncharacterized protein n=1 Tax=Ramalina farinacea TaxID=258253 RepID=A0AA43TY06_9LECA|nr:hypothetical protein [Ramalina farinacea]